ncbi:acetyl/propionyl/methylcrotonyl-CoA carboxylase subunit alpha [Hyphomonas pacifica]|uniref:3-methylcrotonyl-CoA carboxylase subunit alpha n=1 Tax=Hyphomonas pacifica TaxID=1280941 RepID=A0A062U7F7_9PROT|nr:biotin carboxylase N-terminal domain-containing protein [Hyphomonas pacifica]KCZ52090.1 3-methylcrotonyl-CoA carboxylase subunit alpha [Hyphomonas pacifica]RAN32306.1 3-methylcrotonyl-CoA carboxylase subunit alpha [Hyphomonas pacifica]RAN33806.1 3-methylcrotonyl-CoA carboxylase subunit alpha [Hyphomonas pacifica]
MKIQKLLVANRGEIACRIFETCRELGIGTVAVYSDADARAKHVREADEAVHIGPAPAPESYLKGDAIIAAAKAVGADAIHPGYGFLSENADFAEDVRNAGLIWVGPSPKAIRSMGPKDEAKRIAEEAGVPVLPGYRGEAQDAETLTKAAKEIGFPLLIKAVAGGGGRGIRLVSKAADLKAELESAVREAESAFGDGRVMLEKLVQQPRHIEVQVFGDSHGNVVHLYERDCSLQRRRQKVIEEAPAPGMPQEVRAAMTDAAVRLAQAVGYEGAGTVEFIVDGSKPLATDTFWFLEMNTRLQVEHPVTEMITGQDLVAWQLLVASGGELPLNQTEIPLMGHAIEARICAEDPADGFRPGAGLILEFGLLQPVDGETIRWDAGFETGDRVPSNYDSMIAKLIVYGDHRDDAVDQLTEALSHTQLAGVPSNTGFLRRCALSEAFRTGTHHVNWIAEQDKALTQPESDHELASLLAVADIRLDDAGGAMPWDIRDGFRANAAPVRKAAVAVGADADWLDPTSYDLPTETPLPFVTDLSPRRYAVTTGGDTVLVEVPDYDADVEAVLGGDNVSAPMPGKLLAVNVKPGDSVAKGDAVAVMEAMKMEHTLAAPRDGIVESVEAATGDQVAEGDVLVTLEAE